MIGVMSGVNELEGMPPRKPCNGKHVTVATMETLQRKTRYTGMMSGLWGEGAGWNAPEGTLQQKTRYTGCARETLQNKSW